MYVRHYHFHNRWKEPNKRIKHKKQFIIRIWFHAWNNVNVEEREKKKRNKSKHKIQLTTSTNIMALVLFKFIISDNFYYNLLRVYIKIVKINARELETIFNWMRSLLENYHFIYVLMVFVILIQNHYTMIISNAINFNYVGNF